MPGRIPLLEVLEDRHGALDGGRGDGSFKFLGHWLPLSAGLRPLLGEASTIVGSPEAATFLVAALRTSLSAWCELASGNLAAIGQAPQRGHFSSRVSVSTTTTAP